MGQVLWLEFNLDLQIIPPLIMLLIKRGSEVFPTSHPLRLEFSVCLYGVHSCWRIETKILKMK